MTPHTVRIATPTYRGMVTREYSIGVARMACDLMACERWALQAIDQVADHLLVARNVLLYSALQSEADVLLWLDADVALRYEDPETLWSFFAEALDDDVAIVGARCARRTGFAGTQAMVPNVVEDPDVSAHDRAGPLPYDVAAVGLGACLYNLRWWRRRLRPGDAFTALAGDVWKKHESGAMELTMFEWRGGVSEDYAACRFARTMGGRVKLDPLMPTWHDGAEVKVELKRSIVIPRSH